MPTASITRAASGPASRRSARRGLAGAALVAAALTASGASAEEGIGSFLSSIFGGNAASPQSAPAPRPAPNYGSSYAPVFPSAPYRRARTKPLIVRLHQARPKLVIAQSPSRPGKVSIYEDRTLRRGDAVMTADGVRIFAGSSSWPYAAGDFVALTKAKNLDRDTSKVLAQLDRVPRN